MLIQSWSDPAREQTGPIRIFPALPGEWSDVEFHRLRTEGAFLVSARRENGATTWIEIESLAGEPCIIQPNLHSGFRLDGGREHTAEKIAPGIYRIDLRKGETVRVFPVD